MPITEAVARVLDGATPVREAVESLLRREPKATTRHP
jgi:glycerol-3-phosphate dehydrogenase